MTQLDPEMEIVFQASLSPHLTSDMIHETRPNLEQNKAHTYTIWILVWIFRGGNQNCKTVYVWALNK